MTTEWSVCNMLVDTAIQYMYMTLYIGPLFQTNTCDDKDLRLQQICQTLMYYVNFGDVGLFS